jgi:hypothetical protein
MATGEVVIPGKVVLLVGKDTNGATRAIAVGTDGKFIVSGDFALEATLTALLLDHMLAAADGTGTSPASVVDQSILSKILSKVSGGDTSSFNNTTDSLEAIADAIAAIGGVGNAQEATLVALLLDHILAAADGTGVYPASVAEDSILAKILSKADPAVTTSFNNTTDSLEAIADAIAALLAEAQSLSLATGAGSNATLTRVGSLIRWLVDNLSLQIDVGSAQAGTLKSANARLGDVARSLDLILGARWDSSGDLGTDIAAIKAQTDLIPPGTKFATKTSTSHLTTGTLFNWTGNIQILNIEGRVTTQLEAAAQTARLYATADALAALNLCAASGDLTGFVVGTALHITGTLADAMAGTSGVAIHIAQAIPINLPCATSGVLGVTYGTSGSLDGAIVWEVLWIPLTPTSTFVAAA